MNPLNDFIIAFAASVIGAYPVYRLLIALKSRQTVSQFAPDTHQKKQGTPTMGGIMIAVGFLAASVFIAREAGSYRADAFMKTLSVGILFAGFSIIGFVDDYIVPRMFVGKRGLGWKQKILMQLVVAAACTFLVSGVSPISALTVFLILFFSNAYNFSDGLDWLAGLLLLGLGGGLFTFAYLLEAPVIEAFVAALLGASLPFLYLNRPRAKVFMGDVGSLPIGAVLGLFVSALAVPSQFACFYPNDLSSIDSKPLLPATNVGLSLALVLLSAMMIAELVPVPLQILSVKIRKKKLFSFTPIHHAYERKGWPEVKVVAVFVGLQVLFSILAVGVLWLTVPTVWRIG